jgi:peptidoglycan/xylan/chitin deacetylase (PgdA/CDA1 family)
MRPAAALSAGAAAAHLLPSVLTIPPLHQRVIPQLSGMATGPHVALTFDDGPDPASTPRFLDELDRLGLHATFFVLGTQLAAYPDVAHDVVAAGHEIGVHGWLHRPHLLRAPWQVRADLARTERAVRDLLGVSARFARPPNGVVTGAGLWAARSLGLRTVLWTADGQDWTADATADTVATRIRTRLRPGGVILLHDSDITSAPGSWRAALGALSAIAGHCAARGWALGPLGEHWSPEAER